MTTNLLSEPLLTTAPSGRRALTKQDSVIEQMVAAQPLRAQDVVYSTNIVVAEQADATVSGEITPHTPGYPHRMKLDLLLESLPAQKLAGLVTIAMFAGYASLFALQHIIKVFFGIPDDDSKASHSFSFAITSLYVWNLIFRLGHNVLLYPLLPRRRALVGLLSMMISMLILAVGVFTLQNRSTMLVAVAYAFGGIAVGTFETNYSVVLAALGNKTKIYGISGIPIGIFLVIVPGFVAVTAGMPVQYIYLSVVALLVVGIVVLLFGLDYPEVTWLLSADPSVEEGASPRRYIAIEGAEKLNDKTHRWVWPVVSVGLVFTLNMLFVSAFSPGVLLYLYNGAETPLGGSLNTTIPTGYFFAIFSSFGFIADVFSRKRIYASRPTYHPIRFIALTLSGVAIIVTQLPVIAPLGTFLVFYANGSIYAQSCRWLDMRLDPKVLVIATSVFFFLGDCGSVLGAVLIPFIRDVMAAAT